MINLADHFAIIMKRESCKRWVVNFVLNFTRVLPINPSVSLHGVTSLLRCVFLLFRETLSFFTYQLQYTHQDIFFSVKNVCGFSSHNAHYDYRGRGNIQKYPKELPATWEGQTVEYSMNNKLAAQCLVTLVSARQGRKIIPLKIQNTLIFYQ